MTTEDRNFGAIASSLFCALGGCERMPAGANMVPHVMTVPGQRFGIDQSTPDHRALAGAWRRLWPCGRCSGGNRSGRCPQSTRSMKSTHSDYGRPEEAAVRRRLAEPTRSPYDTPVNEAASHPRFSAARRSGTAPAPLRAAIELCAYRNHASDRPARQTLTPAKNATAASLDLVERGSDVWGPRGMEASPSLPTVLEVGQVLEREARGSRRSPAPQQRPEHERAGPGTRLPITFGATAAAPWWIWNGSRALALRDIAP